MSKIYFCRKILVRLQKTFGLQHRVLIINSSSYKIGKSPKLNMIFIFQNQLHQFFNKLIQYNYINDQLYYSFINHILDQPYIQQYLNNKSINIMVVKIVDIVLLEILICSLAGNLLKVHPQANLEIIEYCKYFKYPIEAHDVITEDGYILQIYRIQKKQSTIKEGLPVFFLQHGLLDSSDTWLVNDEDKAPGFMLANKGYDVWMGNSRGNKHSRRHIKYNPDKNPQFWMFSFQDMADYDLPAVFKYINRMTSQKINYIGHSQGTIQMHIALSKNNPVIESLIGKYFGFGPVAFVGHQQSNVINLMIKSPLQEWYRLRHINEFMPSPKWLQTEAGILFCAQFSYVCADLLKYVMDGDPSVDNYKRYDVIIGHQPSGTSLMNMVHWKQIAISGKFQAYDYGSAKLNTQHYGTSTPPQFKLSNIRVGIRLFAGTSDLLADLTDVNHMWESLKPQVKSFLKVYNAGHCTFIWGKDASPWMNDLYDMI